MSVLIILTILSAGSLFLLTAIVHHEKLTSDSGLAIGAVFMVSIGTLITCLVQLFMYSSKVLGIWQ